MKLSEWIDFVRAIVRPFVIISGFVIYGVCVIRGIEVPPILAGLVAATIAEYFGERAILRLRSGQVLRLKRK
ncbi:MAG: hypothetical protein HYX85_00410 [Chloroflexi bacterium]|nr:hypothetical protein [Chloroflexota bacterium]